MARNQNPAADAVARRAEAKETSVREFYERTEAMQPTPTQAENDLAKVGALNVDEKEDDGSEYDADFQRRTMEGRLPGNSPYETREMGGEAQPRRGRRPKSAE